jgi:hypothetical protein
VSFVKPTASGYYRGFRKKISLPFLDIPTSFYEFYKFETISGIYLNKREKEKA